MLSSVVSWRAVLPLWQVDVHTHIKDKQMIDYTAQEHVSWKDSSGASYFLQRRVSERDGYWQVVKDCPFPAILQ